MHISESDWNIHVCKEKCKDAALLPGEIVCVIKYVKATNPFVSYSLIVVIYIYHLLHNFLIHICFLLLLPHISHTSFLNNPLLFLHYFSNSTKQTEMAGIQHEVEHPRKAFGLAAKDSSGLLSPFNFSRRCACVRVCVCLYIFTHIHTSTSIFF